MKKTLFRIKFFINFLISISILFILYSCTTVSNNKAEIKKENHNISSSINELNNFFMNPEDKTRIAILPFTSDYLTNDDTEAIRLHIEETISRNKNYIIIENTEIEEVINSQKELLSGLYDEKYAIKLGKLLFANNVLLMKVGKISDKYYINLKIVNVENGKVERIKNIHTDTINDLLGIISPDLLKDNNNRDNKKASDGFKKIDFNSEEFGINLENRTITIDGIADDWKGIKPIELSKYDNNPFYDRYYVCKDDKFVYLRIDLADKKLIRKNNLGIFFNICRSNSNFKGEINIEVIQVNNHRRIQLSQNLGDPEIESNWQFINLSNDYGCVKEVIEFKVKYDWIQSRKVMYIVLGLHDNNIGNTTKGDLYFSNRIKFNLQ